MTHFEIEKLAPDVKIFRQLRLECGWGELENEVAERALKASQISATAYIDRKPVGFGRVVGDGVMYFYICDVIVERTHRGKGIATALMENLMQQIREVAPQGATLALMAANGKEPLYRKFGFIDRPNGTYGAGMTLFLEPIS